MKKSLAKTLFCEGVLGKAVATPAISEGYNLAFSRINNTGGLEYLETERGEIRTFKSSDAVLSLAKDIGFKVVEFNM